MLILKAIKSHFKRSYDKQSLVLFSLQLVSCRVAAVKRLPLRHHSADYSLLFFRIIGLVLGQFENRVLMKPVLGDVGSVAPLHYAYEQPQ